MSAIAKSGITDFAEQKMQTINGQQFLLQGVFRAFIEKLDEDLISLLQDVDDLKTAAAGSGSGSGSGTGS